MYPLMHEKDYKIWHNKKTLINKEKDRPFFHERDIFFCSLGSNIGFEQDGKGDDFLRPVIVIKKFNKEVCLVIPITKTAKKGKYYFSFSYKEGVSSVAILSQVRLVDAKRLEYKSGTLSQEDFRNLKEKLRQLLA